MRKNLPPPSLEGSTIFKNHKELKTLNMHNMPILRHLNTFLAVYTSYLRSYRPQKRRVSWHVREKNSTPDLCLKKIWSPESLKKKLTPWFRTPLPLRSDQSLSFTIYNFIFRVILGHWGPNIHIWHASFKTLNKCKKTFHLNYNTSV